MRLDYNLLPLFLAVAEEDNFRAAADRLGVTRSAVSQGIRRFEDDLGAMLVTRTTRAVRLTEAGQRLYDALCRPMSDIVQALEGVDGDQSPRGRLRIAVTSIAEPFLSGPLLTTFAEAHPHVIVDVTVTDEEFDIVAAGFDAGVRLGEVIEQDMIAVPVGGQVREAVVASPEYLVANGMPEHPRDLVRRRCIGWRRSPENAPYRWEFEENGTSFNVAVEPQITTNDLRLMLRSALAGAGITFATEETFRPYVESGALVSLLEQYLPSFPGFFLYFPNRRNMAPKLRALVDHINAGNPGGRRGRSR
ncbi:LysR family transcriptional regulator [Mesorhizobium sp. M4A.F.Ca.ET.020.02.1.1]|uniref:LysR family transcriptional regulator n=2 Tax=Mesorhizobium TaxID=68287 RepID=UPI000FD4429C|nr:MULTISPECIES: LysR family transcriptional regulator [unclassified Mesorhizobium]RVD40899.1 LysR family transcriptional regulator [Mesorhizobium sp. M4A.F.Ca.ET.020.02.1.1]RWC12392.1 MAG: LysR family transcriptional regulator [Mesorhizobium sp.]